MQNKKISWPHNPALAAFPFLGSFCSKYSQELYILITSLSSLQIHFHSIPDTVHMTPLKLVIKLPNDLLMPSSVLTYLAPITLGFCAALNIVHNAFLLGILGIHDFSLSSLIIHLVGYLLVFFPADSSSTKSLRVGMHPKLNPCLSNLLYTVSSSLPFSQYINSTLTSRLYIQWPHLRSVTHISELR